jgi:hypothetical protein
MDFTHAHGDVGQQRRLAQHFGSQQVSLSPNGYNDQSFCLHKIVPDFLLVELKLVVIFFFSLTFKNPALQYSTTPVLQLS